MASGSNRIANHIGENPAVPSSREEASAKNAGLRRATMVRVNNQDLEVKFNNAILELDKAKDTFRNSQLAARQQFDAQRKEFEDKFVAQLKRHEEELEKNEAKLTELIGKATVGPISKRYETKANHVRKLGKVFLGFFYGIVACAIGGGGWLAWYTVHTLPVGQDFFYLLKLISFRFLICLPIYIPLFWLVVHFNRWAAQKNRLVEEYEHKRLVFEVYAGLADQVEALVAKGVKTAPEILTKLMDKTVDAIAFDPVSLLDKTKIATPLDEAVERASRLADIATKFQRAGSE